MNQNENINTWAKVTIILMLFFALIGLWAYLAGGIFMQAYGHKYEEATPFTLYQYYYHYGKNKDIMLWIYISSGSSLVIVLLPFMIFFAPAKKSLFGDARFATGGEIARAGLLGEKGIVIGKRGDRYLMYNGQQHVIISAPTRSGKGVGLVIPNLLTWPESVVVLDIKQENWELTSAYRKKHGQECYLFNPAATDYKTHRYNPLEYISDDLNFRIDDIQKIANMLFPDQPGTDVIWTATPRTLFLGVVLFIIETKGKASLNLGRVLHETLVSGDGAKYFAAHIKNRDEQGIPLSYQCIRALNSYISISSENTRAGIITSFRSRLELWMNPLVDAATSANDFDLRSVRKKRMSIYIGVTPDNLDRLAPLINLFFQQLIDLNTRELPTQNKDIKYTCLLLMDEFTAIGKINILAKGISYIAGYWLRMMPLIQSPSQIVEVYGKEAALTFTTNHAMNIVFPPKASEVQTAREISEWLGYQTVKGKSHSRGTDLFSKQSRSENVSDQRRALLLPQEITGLGQQKELIILEHVPPIVAKKITYFNDKEFVDRLKTVSQDLSKLGKKLPTEEDLNHVIFQGDLSAPIPLLELSLKNDIPPFVPAIDTDSGGWTTITVERPVEANDILNQSKDLLAAFTIEFSDIKKPEKGKLLIEDLLHYADTQSSKLYEI